MEFDKLSNRVLGSAIKVHRELARDCWSRPMSSAFNPSGDVVNRTGYYTPQVFFVSFVVKQFCTSARILALHPFS